MDRETLAAYDSDAAAFAEDWHAQPAPHDLHDILTRFFIKDAVTDRLRQRARAGMAKRQRFPGEGF